MPSTPRPESDSDWPPTQQRPAAAEDGKARQDSPAATGPGDAAPVETGSDTGPDSGAQHRPPLPPGQIPASWLPAGGQPGTWQAQPGPPGGGQNNGRQNSGWQNNGWQNSGWNVPARPRRSPEELRARATRTRERLRLFVIMVIGLLIVSQLLLPFRLAGIALGLAAGYVGIRVLIGLAEMRRAGLGARGLVFTLFGLGLIGMLLLVLVSQAVYYPVVSDLEQCEARANTEQAEQNCQDETADRFNTIIEQLNERARST